MASLREIRRKIKSVKSTQQITKAMKMVAAARMRRAQASILASRPFAVKMDQAVRNLAGLEAVAEQSAGLNPPRVHPFFEARQGEGVCLIVVTGDKGLCGAFNANVLRGTIDWLRRHQGKKIAIAIVGKKAREMLHRIRGYDLRFVSELVGVFPKVSFAHAELLGKAVMDAYLKQGCAQVDVIYNEFKSVASQRVVQTKLLPITLPEPSTQPTPLGARGQGEGPLVDFKFEPRREMLLGALLPRHLKAQLYRILLESQAAELAARMNAMDSASKNAGELIDSLTLKLNRTRQGIITREIAELVGGAEALAS